MIPFTSLSVFLLFLETTYFHTGTHPPTGGSIAGMNYHHIEKGVHLNGSPSAIISTSMEPVDYTCYLEVAVKDDQGYTCVVPGGTI